LSNPSIFENPNSRLNPNITDFLTHCTNTIHRALTPLEENFAKRGYSTNVYSGRGWSESDMRTICKTNGSFRQIKFKLRELIETVINSRPKLYKFKELTIDHKLTQKYRDLSTSQIVHGDLDQRLSFVNHEKPMIHNIHLQALSDGVYSNLERNYPKPHNPQNKSHVLKYEIENYTIVVSAYPTDTLSIVVGCTFSPFEYNSHGFSKLFFLLGQIKSCLDFDSKANNIVQSVGSWKFKHFDFNKDSYSFDCDYTVHDVFSHVIMYTKKMPNQTTIFRVEQQEEPNTTILEEMDTVRFQKANEL